MTTAKTIAARAILSELLAFPTINQRDWIGTHSSDPLGSPIEGDLVSLCSAPDSEWCLSWLIESLPTKGFLLESVLTGKLCWWSNVGLNIYSREKVEQRPEWRWTDKQHAFASRWNRVCRKNGAYILLPTGPTFNDDGSVELGTRIRFRISDYRGREVFPNWKKCTIEMMDAFYKRCVVEKERAA